MLKTVVLVQDRLPGSCCSWHDSGVIGGVEPAEFRLVRNTSCQSIVSNQQRDSEDFPSNILFLHSWSEVWRRVLGLRAAQDFYPYQ